MLSIILSIVGQVIRILVAKKHTSISIVNYLKKVVCRQILFVVLSVSFIKILHIVVDNIAINIFVVPCVVSIIAYLVVFDRSQRMFIVNKVGKILNNNIK